MSSGDDALHCCGIHMQPHLVLESKHGYDQGIHATCIEGFILISKPAMAAMDAADAERMRKLASELQEFNKLRQTEMSERERLERGGREKMIIEANVQSLLIPGRLCCGVLNGRKDEAEGRWLQGV
eukprot:45093-Pelagomonas_calceolata.AAC.3